MTTPFVPIHSLSILKVNESIEWVDESRWRFELAIKQKRELKLSMTFVLEFLSSRHCRGWCRPRSVLRHLINFHQPVYNYMSDYLELPKFPRRFHDRCLKHGKCFKMCSRTENLISVLCTWGQKRGDCVPVSLIRIFISNVWQIVLDQVLFIIAAQPAKRASEQQHAQDLRRIYRRGYEFSNLSLFTRMHCI